MSGANDKGTTEAIEQSEQHNILSMPDAKPPIASDPSANAISGRPNELPDKIFLASDEHDESLIHRIIEYRLFFKTAEFKNNPRANAMLIRCIKSVSMVTILCILIVFFLFAGQLIAASIESEYLQGEPQLSSLLRFGNAIKFVLTFLGAISFLFWRSSDLFRQQWNYCSNLYNDTIKATCPKRTAALRASLAIDLIVVDLWAHRSFQGLFRTELWNALLHKYSSEPGRLSEIVGHIKTQKFTESQARKVLEDYQEKLIHKIL